MKRQLVKLDYSSKKQLNNVISKKNYRSSARAKKKAKVILLKSEGKSIKEIMKETKLCKRTIISYVKQYNEPNRDGGMRFIHKNEYKKSSLIITDKEGEDILLDEFKKNPPISYKEASERIKRLFNITISESATRAYLNKHDIYTKRSKKPIRNINTDLEKENDRN